MVVPFISLYWSVLYGGSIYISLLVRSLRWFHLYLFTGLSLRWFHLYLFTGPFFTVVPFISLYWFVLYGGSIYISLLVCSLRWFQWKGSFVYNP